MIPEMVHELGRYWQQPDRLSIDMDVDRNFAYICQVDFDKLLEYSSSCPTGAYAGKMWKACCADHWILRWYEEHPSKNGMVIIKSMPIRISDGIKTVINILKEP